MWKRSLVGFRYPGYPGTLSTTLKGFGTVKLNYGNCYKSGQDKVYLNDQLIDIAKPNTRSKTKYFNYTDGSILKILETGAGNLNMNLINFNCTKEKM